MDEENKYLFIIGDVHGCFLTFSKMIDRNWNPKNEILIQLGDLVDRGTNTPDTVALCRQLENQHPESAIFLKGNHEYEFNQYFHGKPLFDWFGHCGKKTLSQYDNSTHDIQDHLSWLNGLPLFWQNQNVFVSHAGVLSNDIAIYNQRNRKGLLWTREPLRNINKVQVIGHTVQKNIKDLYCSDSNTWRIDTGACYGLSLTGIKLTWDGTMIETISLPTEADDLLEETVEE